MESFKTAPTGRMPSSLVLSRISYPCWASVQGQCLVLKCEVNSNSSATFPSHHYSTKSSRSGPSRANSFSSGSLSHTAIPAREPANANLSSADVAYAREGNSSAQITRSSSPSRPLLLQEEPSTSFYRHIFSKASKYIVDHDTGVATIPFRCIVGATFVPSSITSWPLSIRTVYSCANWNWARCLEGIVAPNKDEKASVFVVVHSFALRKPYKDRKSGLVSQKHAPRYVRHVLEFPNVFQSREFVSYLRAFAGLERQQRVLALVNPFSGTGQSEQTFQKVVEPILKLAGYSVHVQQTERESHTKHIGQTLPIASYDAVALVSGDGLIHELINGLMSRGDWQKAIHSITLAAIPSGTANALAKCIDCPHPVLATLAMVKGKRGFLDLFAVSQRCGEGSGAVAANGCAPSSPLASSPPQNAETAANDVGSEDATLASVNDRVKTAFGFLMICWTFIADVDIESEKIRWAGHTRLTIWAILRLFFLRKYKGRMYYKKSAPLQDYNTFVDSSERRPTVIESVSAATSPVASPVTRTDSSSLSYVNGAAEAAAGTKPGCGLVAAPNGSSSVRQSTMQGSHKRQLSSGGYTSGHSATHTRHQHSHSYCHNASSGHLSNASGHKRASGSFSKRSATFESQLPAYYGNLLKYSDCLNKQHDALLAKGFTACNEGMFSHWIAANLPWISSDTLTAPDADLADGSMHLIWVGGNTRWSEFLSAVLDQSSGNYLKSDSVNYEKVDAIILEPGVDQQGEYHVGSGTGADGNGIVDLDGEEIKNDRLVIEILPNMAHVYVPWWKGLEDLQLTPQRQTNLQHVAVGPTPPVSPGPTA